MRTPAECTEYIGSSTKFLCTFPNNNLCLCSKWQELFVEWYKFQKFCLLPCNVRIKSLNVYKFFWRCMQITCPYVNTTSLKIHVDINFVNKFSIFLPLLPLNILYILGLHTNKNGDGNKEHYELFIYIYKVRYSEK